MKFLYLVRHAKSDWGNEALPDIDRPLNTRGYRDAHAMGERLFAAGIVPQLVVSSPAVRAISTALIFARKAGYPADRIVLSNAVYEAETMTLRNVVAAFPDDTDSVMLFGHNPGFTSLANQLSGAAIDNMPTSSVAAIKFGEKRWSDCAKTRGELLFFEFPKQKIG